MNDELRGPVRVLAYSDSSIFSGAEALLADLVRGLSRSPRIELSCAAPNRNELLCNRLLAEAGSTAVLDVPAQPVRAGAFHLYDPRRRAVVARRLADREWDVILVNLPSAEYGATPLLARRPALTKTLGFLHVARPMNELDFRLGKIRYRLARRAMQQLDAVCVLSDSARTGFKRDWSSEVDIHVVRLPRPQLPRMDRRSARRMLQLGDSPVVGMAGRIAFKQKGQDTLVEAAHLVLETMPETHFAIAGSGRDEERLRRLISARGLQGQFHLLGHVSPITPFFSAIDAIAIPSRFEGLPFVALEALSMGVPGVAASTDGLCDVWPHGWQVPADDPAELARALRDLLNAPADECSRLVEEGRSLMAHCTSENPAATVEKIILGLQEG